MSSLQFAHIDGLIGRAIALIGLGDLDDALADLDHASALPAAPSMGKRPEILWHRGRLYEAKGLPNRAIADYTSALAENPQFVDVFLTRGRLLSSLGQLTQAISDFSFALKLDPQCVDALRGRASCWMSRASPSRHDLTRAVNDLSSVVALNPGDARALLARSHVFVAINDQHQALADYAAAVEADKTLADDDLREQIMSMQPRMAKRKSGVPMTMDGGEVKKWCCEAQPGSCDAGRLRR